MEAPPAKRVAVVVAIDGGQGGQVGQHQQEGGRRVERLGQTRCRSRCRVSCCSFGKLVGVAGRLGLGGPVGDGGPRDQPGTVQSEVLVPAGQIQITQGAAHRRVLDDDHPPTLAIAATGSEAGRIEQAVEDIILDGFGEELAYRAGAPQGLDQIEVHRKTVAGDGRLDPASPTLDTAPPARHCGGMPAHQRLRDLSRFPLVVSPMAGGPSTPALVVAAAEAGAVGFLAAGYKSAAEMRTEIAAVRSATPAPFGVNVFVPGEPTRSSRGSGRLRAHAGGGGRRTGGDARRATLGRRRLRREARCAPRRPARSRQFHVRLSRPRRGARPAGGGSLVVVTVTTLGGGAAGATGGGRLPLPAGGRGGRTPRQLRQRRPPGAGSPARRHFSPTCSGTATSRSSPPGASQAPKAWPRRWRPGRRRCSWGPRSCGAPRAAPIPLYKAALADPRFTVDGHHPRLQRSPGPQPRERLSAGARATRLPPTPRSTTSPDRCAPPPRPPAIPNT